MKNIFSKITKSKFYIPVILTIFSIVLFSLLLNNVRQQEVNIHEGQLAEKTIRANKTVENKYETEEKQKLAMESVTPEYSYNDKMEQIQVNNINNLFKMVSQIQSDDETKDKSNNDKLAQLKSKFEGLGPDVVSFYQSFPQSFYEKIFNFTPDELTEIDKVSTAIISKYMAGRIRQNTLSNSRQNALKELNYYDLSNSELEMAKIIVNNGIIVNEISNTKKTEELREKAKNEVEPVMIYQGEIIVREGSQIDAKAMQKLKVLGLTNHNPSIFPIEALVIAIIFQILIILYVARNMIDNNRLRFVTFYVIMMTISVLGMKFLQLFQTETTTFVAFLFPIAFIPLVLNIFISRITAIMSALFQALFAMFVFYSSIGTSSLIMILMTYVFVGVLATLVPRMRINQQPGATFLWLFAFPIFFQVLIIIYQGMNLDESVTWMTLGSMMVGALLSFLLTLGLHPYIELFLTDDSVIVLDDLSNPNQPLLKQLLETAPGTYHHSMMVANLAANAVAEIGGNAMSTRVACYYHDIGKMKYANFFVENLPTGSENPHNFLLPDDSKQIIFSHVADGVKILKEHHMPKVIIDICEQHHGTTLLQYFYVEAKKRDPKVKEEDFRYPFVKPQTKEAAVVNIADSSEAAIRAMEQPTNEKIREFVHNLINSRIEDGQFDECDITMQDLRSVEDSIVNGLISSFHSRIQYPKLFKQNEQETEE